MVKRPYIILNPAAKGDRARKLQREIARCLPEAKIQLTKSRGHAEELAKGAVADGRDCVVAAGGDGTINEVMNGIGRSGVALGILPVGTVNVFAMELGIPFQLELAAEVLKKGKTRRVDLPSANGRFFVQLAGVGLDAMIVKETDLSSKRTWGPLSYVFTAGVIAGKRPPKLRVIDHHSGLCYEGSFVLAGNGKYYGGPLAFFPEASLRDGSLDFCVFKKQSHLDLIRYFQGILFGTHTAYKDVFYFKSSHVEVLSDDAVPWEVDGELIGEVPVRFKIKKQGLRVIVPDNSLATSVLPSLATDKIAKF